VKFGMQIFRAVLMSCALMFVGAVCLFYPREIQTYILESLKGWAREKNPMVPWMNTEAYVVSLRVLGFFSLCFSLLIVYGLIKQRK
jgi:hypothetical protein